MPFHGLKTMRLFLATVGRCSRPLLLLSLLLWVGWIRAQPSRCRPGVNCLPPDCRCWDDPGVPGNLSLEDVPQMVLLTFQYAVNANNVDFYRGLFGSVKNPNGCPGVGTFYVQLTNSDLSVIKALHVSGHEIGVTTIDGTAPQTQAQWTNNFSKVRDALVGVGIPSEKVRGVRAPELKPGGLNQWIAMASDGFLYDSSCTTDTYDDLFSYLWPYTYDFAPGPACDNGETTEFVFTGKWQIQIADLFFNNTKCATPSACTGVATQRDVFDLFYNSFIKHYQGNKTPFIAAINPDFVTADYKREGIRQFLEYVSAAFPDVWVLTVSQALDWVRNPVNSEQAKSSYGPWQCS